MSYIKRKSQKQEKRTARELGGKAVVASGAVWSAKGDVRTEDYLVENKFTDKDYYPLKLSTWEKIRKEAVKDNFRIPLMQIDIEDQSYIIIEQSSFTIDYLTEGLSVVTDRKSFRLSNKELKDSQAIGDIFKLKFKATNLTLLIIDKDLFLDLM